MARSKKPRKKYNPYSHKRLSTNIGNEGVPMAVRVFAHAAKEFIPDQELDELEEMGQELLSKLKSGTFDMDDMFVFRRMILTFYYTAKALNTHVKWKSVDQKNVDDQRLLNALYADSFRERSLELVHSFYKAYMDKGRIVASVSEMVTFNKTIEYGVHVMSMAPVAIALKGSEDADKHLRLYFEKMPPEEREFNLKNSKKVLKHYGKWYTRVVYRLGLAQEYLDLQKNPLI